MSFGLSAAAIGGIAAAGATVVSGAMSSRAAGKAADTQAQSAREANELSKEQFDAIRGDLAPYRDLGAGSTNLLAQYLGLPQQYTGTRRSYDDIRAEIAAQDRFKAVPGTPGQPPRQLLEGSDGIEQWIYAGGGQPGAPNAGFEAEIDRLAREQYDREEGQYQQFLAGQNALKSDPTYGSLLRNFTGEDLENEPGYQFGLQQGQQQIDRRAASGGNYFSGAALKAAARFGNDYAGTKFGEAFNRDSANKTRIYNFLTGATGIGQNAAAQTGNAGQTMAQQVGATTTSAANAAGAAQIAQGNAWAGGLNNLAGMYQQNQLMDKITGGNSGWGGGEAWRTTGSGMPW